MTDPSFKPLSSPSLEGKATKRPFSLLSCWLLVLLWLVACYPAPLAVDTIPSAAEAVETYRTMHLVTPQSRYLDDPGLCRLPIPGADRPVHSWVTSALKIYVNEAALEAMAEGGQRTFPVGSVVVKEKQVTSSHSEDEQITGLGLMIKREAGYNPQGDDWQYAYWEEDKLYQNSEEIAHCQACHHDGQIPDIPLPLREQWYLSEGNLIYLTLTNEARDSVFFSASVADAEGQ